MGDMHAVSIRRSVLNEIRSHARRELPLECCGLLSGAGNLIDRATATTNQRKSSTAFAIPPEELVAFFKQLRSRPEQFMGIYHSHPSGRPVPSERDAREFYYPEATYWIVGSDLQVGCYRWEEERFQQCPFEIVA